MKQTLEEVAKEYANENAGFQKSYMIHRFLIIWNILSSTFLLVQSGRESNVKMLSSFFFRSHCKYAVTEFNCHMYREDVACCIENCDLFKQFILGEG
jgi:hypothetical protein